MTTRELLHKLVDEASGEMPASHRVANAPRQDARGRRGPVARPGEPAFAGLAVDAEIGGGAGDRAAGGENLGDRPLHQLSGVLPRGCPGDGVPLLPAPRACSGVINLSTK